MAFTEKYVSSLAGGSGNGNTEGTAYSYGQMVTLISGGTTAGWRFNIKADGTYNRSADDNLSAYSGTNANPICWRGYKTTIGDGYLGRSGTNGALITTNMPVIQWSNGGFNSGQYWVLESVDMRFVKADYGMELSERSGAIGCCFQNSSAVHAAGIMRTKGGLLCLENDFTYTPTSSTTTNPMILGDGDGGKLISCRIISNCSTVRGIVTGWWMTVAHCLIKGAGGSRGIEVNDQIPTLFNNTITNWQDGIYLTSTQDRMPLIWGNMVTDNSGYAVNGTSNGMAFIGPNRVRDNVSGTIVAGINSSTWLSIGRFWPLTTTGTGTAADYVNAASNDYNLVSTSAALDTSYPKFADFGAYHALTTITGGTTAAGMHPLIPQIIRPAPND
jgi:hypothetical protein